jgi:hypothetical protein
LLLTLKLFEQSETAVFAVDWVGGGNVGVMRGGWLVVGGTAGVRV